MRVVVLAPISASTPPLRALGALRLPAHRGPRGPRSRRRPVRPRPTRIPRRAPRRSGGHRLVRGPGHRSQGGRVPAHFQVFRPRCRLRSHPTGSTSPAPHLRRAGRHAGGLLRRRASCPSTRSTTAAVPMSPSATLTATRPSTTWPPSTTASTPRPSRWRRRRETTSSSSPHPSRQGHGGGHRRGPSGPASPWCWPASSRTSTSNGRWRPASTGTGCASSAGAGRRRALGLPGGALALLHLIDFDEAFGFSAWWKKWRAAPRSSPSAGLDARDRRRRCHRDGRRRHVGRGRCHRRGRRLDRRAIREVAVRRFGVDRMVDAYVDVYERVVASCSVPDRFRLGVNYAGRAQPWPGWPGTTPMSCGGTSIASPRPGWTRCGSSCAGTSCNRRCTASTQPCSPTSSTPPTPPTPAASTWWSPCSPAT